MTKLPHQLSLLSFLLNPLTLLIFVMSATLYFAARHRAYRHWESAELLEERGELQRAVLHYQWAARAYYPGSQVGHQALVPEFSAIILYWALITRYHILPLESVPESATPVPRSATRTWFQILVVMRTLRKRIG